MGFSVSNGQIIGPNGQPFIAGGVDIWAGQVINDPTGSANLIASLFPNANMVRIAAGDGYAADTAAALTPFVNLMTSKGIVVEIGNYNPALTSNVGSGQGTHWTSSPGSPASRQPSRATPPSGSAPTTSQVTSTHTVARRVPNSSPSTMLSAPPAALR